MAKFRVEAWIPRIGAVQWFGDDRHWPSLGWTVSYTRSAGY